MREYHRVASSRREIEIQIVSAIRNRYEYEAKNRREVVNWISMRQPGSPLTQNDDAEIASFDSLRGPFDRTEIQPFPCRPVAPRSSLKRRWQAPLLLQTSMISSARRVFKMSQGAGNGLPGSTGTGRRPGPACSMKLTQETSFRGLPARACAGFGRRRWTDALITTMRARV